MERRDIKASESIAMSKRLKGLCLNTCVGFTLFMVMCMIFGSIFADEDAKRGIFYCWSILGACAVAAVMQFVFFTDALIRHLSYPVRLILFGICLYAILAGMAFAFAWFPMENPGAWISFSVIYLLIFAAISLCFHLCEKRQTKLMNERLASLNGEDSGYSLEHSVGHPVGHSVGHPASVSADFSNSADSTDGHPASVSAANFASYGNSINPADSASFTNSIDFTSSVSADPADSADSADGHPVGRSYVDDLG